MLEPPPRLAVATGARQQADEAQVGRLVVRLALEQTQQQPDRRIVVVAGDASIGERGGHGEIRGPGLLPQRHVPVDVRVVLEHVADVHRLRRREHAGGGLPVTPSMLGEGGIGGGEEAVDIELDVIDVDTQRIPVGLHEVLGVVPLVGIEHRTHRRDGDRETTGELRIVVVGPQAIHRLLARQRSPAPREQHLEEVACLA